MAPSAFPRRRQLEAAVHVRSVRLQADRDGPAKAGRYVRADYTLGGDEG